MGLWNKVKEFQETLDDDTDLPKWAEEMSVHSAVMLKTNYVNKSGILSALDEDEKVHFAFGLPRAVSALFPKDNYCLIVIEEGRTIEDETTQGKWGSKSGIIAITDKFVRIHASRGDDFYRFSYDQINGAIQTEDNSIVLDINNPEMPKADKRIEINLPPNVRQHSNEINKAIQHIQRRADNTEEEKRNENPSALDKLEKLSELADQGIISEEEFEEKKEELLDKV